MKTNPADSLIEVNIVGQTRGYDGFFKVDVYELEHEQFDGSMSPRFVREIFERGTAVGVLPYDPVRDEVLLIRQFLPGAYIAGRDPRPLQCIAGMVEEGESALDVARRESIEEAGCEIGQVTPAQSFLPSPGGTSEHVETFCAQADLANAGGIHGLDDENEDIRVEVVSADEAIALLDSGQIEAAIAVVLLSWFARNRDRLRAEWLA